MIHAAENQRECKYAAEKWTIKRPKENTERETTAQIKRCRISQMQGDDI